MKIEQTVRYTESEVLALLRERHELRFGPAPDGYIYEISRDYRDEYVVELKPFPKPEPVPDAPEDPVAPF